MDGLKKKQTRPMYMLPTRDSLQLYEHIWVQSEVIGKGIPWKWYQKKAREVILLSDKIDFKPKTITSDKEGHCIMITGSIYLENKTIVNIMYPT